jgi:hypothetical protein
MISSRNPCVVRGWVGYSDQGKLGVERSNEKNVIFEEAKGQDGIGFHSGR